MGLITPDILPPGLQLDHDPSLDAGELDVMAPVLMPALLSGLAGNIVGLEKPRASPLSTSFEIRGSMKGFGSGPPMSGGPGTPIAVDLNLPVPDSLDDIVKCETFSHEMSPQDSPIPGVTTGDISEIVIDDDDDPDKTIEDLQPPVAEPTHRKKRSRDEAGSSSSPPRRARCRRRRLQHHLRRMTCPPVSDLRISYPRGTTPFVVTTHGFTR